MSYCLLRANPVGSSLPDTLTSRPGLRVVANPVGSSREGAGLATCSGPGTGAGATGIIFDSATNGILLNIGNGSASSRAGNANGNADGNVDGCTLVRPASAICGESLRTGVGGIATIAGKSTGAGSTV